MILPIFIHIKEKSEKELREEMEREARWCKMIEEDEARQRAREEKARLDKLEAKRKKEKAIQTEMKRAEQNNPWEFMVLPDGWNMFGQYVIGTIPWDGPEDDFKKF